MIWSSIASSFRNVNIPSPTDLRQHEKMLDAVYFSFAPS